MHLDGYQSANDLFGNYRLEKGGRVLDERAGLLAFFSQSLNALPKRLAIRLSHYSLSDLYALKSGYQDRLTRNDKLTARKYFYWMTKTALAGPPDN